MNQTIEKTILKNLLKNEAYTRKVVPFIKEEYFHDRVEKMLFTSIFEFVAKYNSLPPVDALSITLSNASINEDEFKTATKLIEEIDADADTNEDWLIEQTEKFCKDKAVYNAIMESIHIIDGKSTSVKTENAIPEILSEALSVSFDTSVGHDYIEDAEDRYQFYHKVEEKVPFDISLLNTITNGGTPTKTLNIVMAGTGVGKYSTTAGNNTDTQTVNFSEGMAPSNVNNAARETMANVRAMYNQIGEGFYEFGDGDGTYTVDDIIANSGYSKAHIQSGVTWDLDSDPATNAPMCAEFGMDWAFWSSNQQGTYSATQDFVNGNVYCGLGLNPWEGNCPPGMSCIPEVIYGEEMETFYGNTYTDTTMQAACIPNDEIVYESKKPKNHSKILEGYSPIKNRLQILAGIKKPK